MRGSKLLQVWRGLSSEQQEYIISYYIGGLDMVDTGFTVPHVDQAKAKWALDEFEAAIEAERERETI